MSGLFQIEVSLHGISENPDILRNSHQAVREVLYWCCYNSYFVCNDKSLAALSLHTFLLFCRVFKQIWGFFILPQEFKLNQSLLSLDHGEKRQTLFPKVKWTKTSNTERPSSLFLIAGCDLVVLGLKILIPSYRMFPGCRRMDGVLWKLKFKGRTVDWDQSMDQSDISDHLSLNVIFFCLFF